MSRTEITSGFWRSRLDVNAAQAIFHQWQQLEASGCINNFRLVAGELSGFRQGWFFADSDAYKWLEAAARIQPRAGDPGLQSLIDDFIDLLGRAQSPDGYLFTYNQLHFPTVRWQNLQIEHELYCHGHLIEAGVSHFEATGDTRLLEIARRAADRVVEDFLGRGPEFTPGHEEIEIALLRLHEAVPGDTRYLEMAAQLIERRGRRGRLRFALDILKQNADVDRRARAVKTQRDTYLDRHPGYEPYKLPPGNAAKKPKNALLRWYASALSGRYFQQHAPVRKQSVPVGHSVRFAYLETAAAKLCRLSGDGTLLPALEQAWEHMVTRRMYVTGGIGSLPSLEGFGNDYELDPEYAYAETCAALASMFWSWEMLQLTGRPRYSDLFEWQLYNAAAVGMGLDGRTYLYNNPLACHGGITRKPWYAVPCCPSNLSRTWANLGEYVYSRLPAGLRINQYISSEYKGPGLKVVMQSALPWDGLVKITVQLDSESEFTLSLRLPSWSLQPKLALNGEALDASGLEPEYDFTAAAQGYDPRLARMFEITRLWKPGDELALHFDMPLTVRAVNPAVLGHKDKVAITRGPLVYCLESLDNPDVDIFQVPIDIASLKPVLDKRLLGGITRLVGFSTARQPLILIPYALWANRGPSQMTVWTNT